MSDAVYDVHADFYVEFIDRVRPQSTFALTLAALEQEIGDVAGLDLCDLACGEGWLSRRFAERGARVRGYDSSPALIDVARARGGEGGPAFAVDDAQSLASVPDAGFDLLVCHMAVMDIPDIEGLFATAHRVLRPGGRAFFTMLHPCFETPFTAPDSIVERGADGDFVACRVMRYSSEGFWMSGGDGVRGHMGAWHRTLSTCFNALADQGFVVTRLLEPTLPPDDYGRFEDQWMAHIPRLLTFCCRR